ncbi:Canalicular multispecific organic anion transporter 2, partial [Globisporangium polare]
MKKFTEAFKAIGVVKFNAWEDKFIERIDEARELELKDLLHMRTLASLNIVLTWGMPVFISMASFGTFSAILHHELTPAIVFSSIALFQLIQGPLRQIT